MDEVRSSVAQSWSLGVGLMLCFCLLNYYLSVVESTTYTVGDEHGWSLNVSDWPKGKSFKAGDVLVFRYKVLSHNVAVVDEIGYNRCRLVTGSKSYYSGNDKLDLYKGDNYFICAFPGHCNAGMRIAVHAT